MSNQELCPFKCRCDEAFAKSQSNAKVITALMEALGKIANGPYNKDPIEIARHAIEQTAGESK